MQRHAASKHASSAPQCFPKTTLSLSLGAAGGIEHLLGGQDDEAARIAHDAIQDYVLFRHSTAPLDPGQVQYFDYDQDSPLRRPETLSTLLSGITEGIAAATNTLASLGLSDRFLPDVLRDRAQQIAMLENEADENPGKASKYRTKQIAELGGRIAALNEAVRRAPAWRRPQFTLKVGQPLTIGPVKPWPAKTLQMLERDVASAEPVFDLKSAQTFLKL